MATTFPVFRVLGGLLLVVAGLFAFYNVSFLFATPLLLVFAGAAVLLIAVTGHRPHGGDVAIFVVGVIVLAGVSAGFSTQTQLATYSATKSQVQAGTISLVVVAATGSVSVRFADVGNLAYQVNFTRGTGFFPFFWSTGPDRLTNSTADGTFTLRAESTASSVSILIGRGYTVDLNLRSSTGSVDLLATGNEVLHNVTLSTATGSVSARVDSDTITNMALHASTGSVSLVSNRLGAAGQRVPLEVSTSTGSVSARVSFESGDAVSVTATTSLGSVSHSLTGFTTTQDTQTQFAATAGNVNTASSSFIVSASASLGSVSLNLGFTS